MDKPFSFAQRLQYLIDAKGITKSELARACGINKSNVTRYLGGQYEAKQDVIYSIARKYNVSETWLMGYDTPMERQPAFDLQFFGEKKEDPALAAQHQEINEIFDRMPPELRTHALALLKGLVPGAQSPDDPGGSD